MLLKKFSLSKQQRCFVTIASVILSVWVVLTYVCLTHFTQSDVYAFHEMPPQSRKVGIQADPALAASVFDTIDLNRNGKISWEELWAAARPDVTDVLQALHQQSLSIERLLRENDSSGDGTLSFSEFQKLLMRLHIEIDQETATEVFKRLDADGDQQLSLKKLMGKGTPGAPVKAVISQLRSLRLLRGISLADLKSFCDANGDAKLTKEHFLQILLKVAWHSLFHLFLQETWFEMPQCNSDATV